MPQKVKTMEDEDKKDEEEASENGEGAKPEDMEELPDNAHDIIEHQAEEETKDAAKYEKIAEVFASKYHDDEASDVFKMISEEEKNHAAINSKLLEKYDEESEGEHEDEKKAMKLMHLSDDEEEDK